MLLCEKKDLTKALWGDSGGDKLVLVVIVRGNKISANSFMFSV